MAASHEESARPTRLDRRKARTRRALLDAAREILVEHGIGDVSIQEITERADVGFGSFYNHFSSKTELFEAAITEALDVHGALLDAVTAGIEDPAELVAVAVRATAGLADTHRTAAQIMTRIGLEYLMADHGLAPRALRDIRRGIEAGRFTVSSPHLGLVTTAGCLLAYVHVRLHSTEELGDDSPDELAEQVLRMLGMNSRSARRGGPPPPTGRRPALASIFHDLDAERPLSCTNTAYGLHRNGATRVGSIWCLRAGQSLDPAAMTVVVKDGG